ncbi:MAG: GNAT family N-acetyltransferase [Polyangiaceae bacterium]
MFEIVAARPEHFEKLSALFEACACTCYCRYWHFTGTKNDWLARAAFTPEESRSELGAALSAHDDTARGLVAIDSTLENKPIVGWMKLAPRAALVKLRNLGPYRAQDLGADDGVFSIGCFLVHPEHRKRGVASALVNGAPAVVRAWNGKAIEAYPHAIDRAMYDEEAWMGPVAIFERAGFVKIAGEAPYPVLRLVIDSPGSQRGD